MSDQPVDISHVLDSFTKLWSPRIVTRVNDYDVRVAKIADDFVWHTHDDTDELFLVLDGELDIALREPAGERTVRLRRGSVFVVPKGTEHKPISPGGASIMLLEPSGTVNVGDRHDDVPDHITPSTGQEVEG